MYRTFEASALFVVMAEKKIKSEIQNDYRLIGLSTSLREYKLCFHLNQLIGTDFRKLPNLVFESSDHLRKIGFSVFSSLDGEEKNSYIVFANKSLGEVLLSEISQFDFLIKISDSITDKELNELLDSIGQLPNVIFCTEIELKKIKNKGRLEYVEEKTTQKLMLGKKRTI
jgi:hypothetical protein